MPGREGLLLWARPAPRYIPRRFIGSAAGLCPGSGGRGGTPNGGFELTMNPVKMNRRMPLWLFVVKIFTVSGCAREGWPAMC